MKSTAVGNSTVGTNQPTHEHTTQPTNQLSTLNKYTTKQPKQTFSQQTLLHQKTELPRAPVSPVWEQCQFRLCREINSFRSSWMDSNSRLYMITLWFFSISCNSKARQGWRKLSRCRWVSRRADLERRSAEISGSGHWAGSTTGSFQPAAFLQQVKLFAFSFNSILLKALLYQCMYAIAHACTSPMLRLTNLKTELIILCCHKCLR